MGAPSASATTPPLRVHVLAYDGVEELDFLAPLDILAKAAFKGGAVSATLVSPDLPGSGLHRLIEDAARSCGASPGSGRSRSGCAPA